MRSARSLPKRAASLALFGVFAAAAGCTEIFGFERSDDIVTCVHDSDCPGMLRCLSNTCTIDCRFDEDCHVLNYLPGTASCVQNMCISRRTPPDASGSDRETNDTGDAPSDATDSAPPTESSAPEAGAPEGGLTCTPDCPTFSACEEASCLDFQRYGYPGLGPSSESIAGGFLVSFKIFPEVCGFVTGIGFVNIRAAANQSIRFGLYSDNSGQPDQLIAQTSQTTLVEGANEMPVASPALVGCADVAPHYWLTGLWNDTTAITFESELSTDDTASKFANINVPPEDLITAGLPPAFPQPVLPVTPPPQLPHVYLIVARTK